MSQQINLYQPIFRTQHKIFSAVTIAQLTVVFVVGLLLIYGYGVWQLSRLEGQVAALDAHRETAMQQLRTLSTQVRPETRSRMLDDQLREAQSEVNSKERLLTALETRRFGNTTGFSMHFAGLARQRINGLWLTRVEVRDGVVVLDGATEAAELLPRYLARLGQEQAFAGTEFSRLQMARGDGDGAPVRFAVTTLPAEGR